MKTILRTTRPYRDDKRRQQASNGKVKYNYSKDMLNDLIEKENVEKDLKTQITVYQLMIFSLS